MSTRTSVEYACCKAKYSAPTELAGGIVETMRAFDRLHASDHPECPAPQPPMPNEAAS